MSEKFSKYDKFHRLLKSRGVRAADVSRATGLSNTIFSEWKKGKGIPKIDKLTKIADYFGVPVDYFLDDNEKSSSPRNERAAACEFVYELSDTEWDQYLSVCKAMFPDKFKE